MQVCLAAQSCPNLATPRTVAHQASLSMGFPRQEHWSGCHALLQGIFLTQGSSPSFLHLLHWQADSLPLNHLGSPIKQELSIIMTSKKQVVFVQSLSRVWLFVTPWTAAHQASRPLTNSRSLLKLKSIESVMPSNHLILCCLLLLLPYIFPSIRVFSNESVLPIRWPKYWNFGFSISPSNEYSGLIFFRIDWFDLQGTLKSLLQHHSSKASILRHSAFWKLRQLKKLTAISKSPL